MRRNTFFRFNRFFLLTGIVTSLIIPAIDITYDVILSTPLISGFSNYTSIETTEKYSSLNVWEILGIVYCFGMGILILRNILSYIKLSAFVSKGKRIKDKGYNLIENSTVNSPFTVLNYILINTERLDQTEKDLILKHEKTHIDQKHWIDLICSECMLVLQWFNPLVWIYVRLLKENHEYLADQAVIDSGISPALYQAVLINQEFQGPVFSFSNSFNYLKPLNRLSMIKKTKSASWKRLAALIIVPAFGLFFWASAEPRYIIEQADYIPELSDKNFSNDTINLTVSVTDDGNNDFLKKGNIVVIESKDSIKNKTRFLTKIVRTANDSGEPLFLVNGEKVSNIAEISPDNIENVTVLKNNLDELIATYGGQAKNGVVLITTKNANWKSTNMTGKLRMDNDSALKASSYHITMDDSVKVIGSGTALKGSPVRIMVRSLPHDDNKKPLVILDGKKIPFEEMDNIDPKSIESMSVLKDKTATEMYGEEGKNGVIIIETKSYTKQKKDKEK